MLFNSFGVGGSFGNASGKQACPPDWDAGRVLLNFNLLLNRNNLLVDNQVFNITEKHRCIIHIRNRA